MSPADKFLPPPAPAAAHLSAAVLRQYAAGTLSPAERRRVEHHALDCALCADALEGYQQAAPAAVTPAALAGLQQRLHARVGEEEAVRAPRAGAWWMAAAAAVAVLLLALGLWTRQTSQPSEPLATKPTAPAAAATPPAVAAEPTPVDSAADAVAAVRPAAKPAAVGGRRTDRRRPGPAAVAARSARRVPAVHREEAETADLSGLGNAAATSSPVAGLDVAAATPPVAPAESKEQLDPAATEADAPAPLAAKAKMAAPAASEPAPPVQPETGKRKAELPAAPDLAPFPVGGYPALRGYLRREQKRPDTGIGSQAHSDGIVKLKFIVEADGSVHNIQVVRGVNPEYDEEAIRLVCEGPAWRPAIINGRRAAQAVRLDVPFH